MGLGPSLPAVVARSNDGVFFDLEEVPGAVALMGSLTRRGYSQTLSVASSLLSTAVGTGSTVARRNGILGREWTSVLNALGTAAQATFPWPIGANWATLPPTNRYSSRWNFEFSLLRIGVTLGVPFAAGIQVNGAAVGNAFGVAGAAALAGINVGSVSTLNGGRWTVAVGHQTGVAPVTFDTGILPSTAISVRIVYEDSPTPRTWAEVNGTVFGLTEGIANVPVPADAAPAVEKPYFAVAIGAAAGSPAGQVDRQWGARVWAQDLSSVY